MFEDRREHSLGVVYAALAVDAAAADDAATAATNWKNNAASDRVIW